MAGKDRDRDPDHLPYRRQSDVVGSESGCCQRQIEMSYFSEGRNAGVRPPFPLSPCRGVRPNNRNMIFFIA